MPGLSDDLGMGPPPGVSPTGNVGFYGTAPIARPSSTGQTAGFSAGAGANVLVDSTFTGGVGATAYTVGDVVRHLKNLGLIAP